MGKNDRSIPKKRKWFWTAGLILVACIIVACLGAAIAGIVSGPSTPTARVQSITPTGMETKILTPTAKSIAKSTAIPTATLVALACSKKIPDIPLYPGAVLLDSRTTESSAEYDIAEEYRIDGVTVEEVLDFYEATMPRFDWVRAPREDVGSQIAFLRSGDFYKGLAYISAYQEEGFVELHISKGMLKPTPESQKIDE